MNLKNFFQENPKIALGFSGGVDSSYLLYAGITHGANIRPYYIKTAFQPGFELTNALHLAQQLDVNIVVLDLDILALPTIVANPANRCYHCKRAMFSMLKRQAKMDGYSVLIDGTNASDDVGDRPGMLALKELLVRSPLRECGLTKDDVRRLSKEAKLPTWDKPAYTCLATRLPTGEPYTSAILNRIENAENALFGLGFSDFRVRVFHDAAKLQFPAQQMSKAIEMKSTITKHITPFFSEILLDLEGR